MSDRPRSDIHLGEYHAIDDQSVFVHRANFVLFLTVKGQGTDEVRVRWLLAPAGTQGDQAFIHCVYEVMDVQVDVDDLQLVPVSVLQHVSLLVVVGEGSSHGIRHLGALASIVCPQILGEATEHRRCRLEGD